MMMTISRRTSPRRDARARAEAPRAAARRTTRARTAGGRARSCVERRRRVAVECERDDARADWS
eukprot:14679-Pelagococcus_subviridis.AAC.1